MHHQLIDVLPLQEQRTKLEDQIRKLQAVVDKQKVELLEFASQSAKMKDLESQIKALQGNQSEDTKVLTMLQQ